MVMVLAHWIDMIVMEMIEIGTKVIVSNLEVQGATLNTRWVA